MAFSEEIKIKILSELYEVEASAFTDIDEDEVFDEEKIHEQSDMLEMNTFGTLRDDGDTVSISYTESEASGMEGSDTIISFRKSSPEMVTMTRDGAVSATLVFEDGKRHHCLYKTPFMPFEVGVYTKNVINSLLEDGTLNLDYIVEIRGAKAERTRFKMQIIR